MPNYIESADLNIHDGTLEGNMPFRPGLNILSGENGTLKTKVLQFLHRGTGIHLHDPNQQCRQQAISPKRNSQRRAYRQIFDQFRRENKKLEALINARDIDDATFHDYPALGDLFYGVFEESNKPGGHLTENMNQTATEFNDVIRQIFAHYELVAEWDSDAGTPSLSLLKHGGTRVPLDGLSLGEQEVLSLAISIHSSRHLYDVFLIDEPEVHLNWHLEECLFDFLDAYCRTQQKQLIVVTHSRVVFTRKFLPQTTFLYWDQEGKVRWGPSVTDEQRRRIAGEAIEIIQVGAFPKLTMFVEDTHHVDIISAIAAEMGVDVSVTACTNKSNVRSLYKYSKYEGGWNNTFFMEDGDNEGSPFPGESHFIHLDKYCIETFLLDLPIASAITGRTEDQVQQHLLDAILANKVKIFRKNQFFDFLVDHLAVEHLTPTNLAKLDTSEIIDTLLIAVGMSFADYVRAYVHEAADQGRLNEVLPTQIVTLFTEQQNEIADGSEAVAEVGEAEVKEILPEVRATEA